MSAEAVELDPVVVELFAIRNFTSQGFPVEVGEPLEEQRARHEHNWRALKAEDRDRKREAAAEMLKQLLADGLSIRPTKASTDALHKAITNPATFAYVLPARPKADATPPP